MYKYDKYIYFCFVFILDLIGNSEKGKLFFFVLVMIFFLVDF